MEAGLILRALITAHSMISSQQRIVKRTNICADLKQHVAKVAARLCHAIGFWRQQSRLLQLDAPDQHVESARSSSAA